MIHFLLTSDISSSFALKRKVAERAPGSGVIVGNWYELLGLARNAFLLPYTQDRWQVRLEAAISTATDSFWSASLKAVPAEAPTIISILGKTLSMLLEGAGLQANLTDAVPHISPGRTADHLKDLAELHLLMEGVLPPHLDLIARILASSPDRQLRHIHVYHRPGWPNLDPWQLALVEHLNDSSSLDDRYAKLLEQSVFAPSAREASTLGVVQRNLFQATKDLVRLDDTLQCLAVRDHLQEAEIAAGMMQQALCDNPELRPADFALLLPSDRRYYNSVRNVFSFAGLPLSGLRAENDLRDIGNETIHLLLLCMNKPAPVLALASLLVSPLMPWEPSRGNLLAQQVVKGKFDLKEWEGCTEGARLILKALRTPPGTSHQLAFLLKKLSSGLNQIEGLESHCKRASAAIKRIIGVLETTGTEIPWNELHPLCTSESLASSPPAPTREGIAIFHEGEEPWRQVNRLWVLGCSDGHYPASIGHSPVFSKSDLERLRDQGRFAVCTAADHGQRLRELFRRQLCAASDAVTFLIPRRDPLGKPLSPSPAITFMASQFIDDNVWQC